MRAVRRAGESGVTEIGWTASVRKTARGLGLGRAALRFYYRPVGLVRQCIQEGGPWEQRRTEAGRLEMVDAAKGLPALSPPDRDIGARVAFLSGERYWYQTLFCFFSLQRQASFRITPVVFEDGTLTEPTRDRMRRVAPWMEFVSHDESEAGVEAILPASSFPALRARRAEYPHLRKLTDIHARATGWTLVLDSDMLFFRSPDAVFDWFARPRALFIQDVENAYGYPLELMAELGEGPPLEVVNVGLYALNGPEIDWPRVEYWCRVQLERYGPQYVQEQALTALALGCSGAIPLPRRDYVVMPDLAEGRTPTAALHHYVAASKRSYFQYGWRRVVTLAPCGGVTE